MLKALETVGFKSFADKTLFEFPPGITVIVGPNGSGKSNIVDAIKWVLGEQSVKTLRGKEMADVIFKGSGTGTRRALNTAEATLTMDNSGRLLSVDTDEVHITRRVYRSGEGEYLINRQPCRLRDVRDLFFGTGVATEAYSVIEQGKVDAMLKASARDRRVIFEEAAGISRFKAKRIEAMRRMERVEQNLLRLSDIVDEVEARLRSVRLQANKAARYKQYTDRLQQLRTQVGMADWRRLTVRLDEFEQRLAEWRQQADSHTASAEAAEAAALVIDTQLADADQAIRAGEARIAANRERIATCESTIQHQRARSRDVEKELARQRRQVAAMGVRAGDVDQQLEGTTAQVESARAEYQRLREQVARQERSLTELTTALDELRSAHQQRRGEHVGYVRETAAMASRISGLQSQVAAARATRQRRQARIEELTVSHGQLNGQLESLRRQTEQLVQDVEDRGDELAGAQSLLAERRRQWADTQSRLNSLGERHAAAAERAALLDELEQRLEGVSAGVKQVLVEARTATAGPYVHVRGLVADRLRVSMETAPLIDAALGERAQHVIVSQGSELATHFAGGSARLAGRVGFVRLDVRPSVVPSPEIDLSGEPGVVGRADRFVETEAEYAPLAQRLLGRTWIVENLGHAARLAEARGRQVRFVTLAGELLEADGTLVVGPRQGATGLISRRSELRVLREEIARLDGEMADWRRKLATLQQQIEEEEQHVGSLTAEHQQAGQRLSEQRMRTGTLEERLAQLTEQRTSLAEELLAADEELAAAEAELREAQQQSAHHDATISELEAQLQQQAQRIRQLEADRAGEDQSANLVRVELAKSEQRLDHLHARLRQFEQDQRQRQQDILEARDQLAQCTRRVGEAERMILAAEAEVAGLYLRKESLGTETARRIGERDQTRARRRELAQQAQQDRGQLRKVEEQMHAVELDAGQVRHERATLAERMLEDYDIDLNEVARQPVDEETIHERERIDEEIADLRRKVNNIGGVNLDALDELQSLEDRHAALSTQHADLTAAKQSLAQIIHKINEDSRRLFAETLQAVRENFGRLFRKAFGGGRADIAVEAGEDILEGGIEIVATPPGKGALSTSLLSGGERALTAVTLLLAIFKYRPSPFCVLDEVDAPLDEANIDRFIRLLKEFPSSTQFIVISHSKKTMTAADTLYGVTMQESGVSKRVSVRFESDAAGASGSVTAADFDPDTTDDETQAA